MLEKQTKQITPNEEYEALNEALNVPKIILKREDLHPYGSHKGRSIPVMIDKYSSEGYTHFVISSSGNAALAAALYIKELNKDIKNKLNLEILVGNKIKKSKLEKLEKLKDGYIKLSLTEKPLQSLFERIKDTTVKSLRQSNDDNALVGYKSLAIEISNIEDVRRIYIGTSSGTTAQALAQYFIQNKKDIEVNIVQTSSCHHMVLEITEDLPKNEISIADAIVDQTALRKKVLLGLVEKTGGKGYIATNDEIMSAQNIVFKNTGLKISTNSALSIVGLMKDFYTRELPGTSVCIICGE